jgi:hypothetical protein
MRSSVTHEYCEVGKALGLNALRKSVIKKHPERIKTPINDPFIIGAVIDLGYCLDLLNSDCLELLQQSYEILRDTTAKLEVELPTNKPIGKDGDLLLRHLDCAVIQSFHSFNDNNARTAYDSVRGAFWEGKELYPNAGFKEKNHIQICVRNPNCIKGYFKPRSMSEDYPRT